MRHDQEIREFIAKFDAGESVQVIEMGGLSDGYELAIWEMTVRLLDKMVEGLSSDPDIDWTEDGSWPADKAFITEIADQFAETRGLTGAQYGAACNAATVFFRHGIEGGLDMARDRVITIAKSQLINPWGVGTEKHNQWNEAHA